MTTAATAAGTLAPVDPRGPRQRHARLGRCSLPRAGPPGRPIPRRCSGSLADTGLDVIASLTTLAGVRIAAIPADQDHRFGHGKAEALVALAQVVLITVSAVGIAWRAIDRLLGGAQTEAMGLGIAVSLLAIAGTFALLWYQHQVIARTGSVAIRTDNVHYKSDLMLNGAVIVALVLDQALHISGADALFGIAIALWLAWGAYRASSESINQLMDREWPEAERQ